MINKNFIEDCWYLYGIRFGRYIIGYRKYHGSGTAGGVEFNYKTARNKWVVGWYHTHPGIKNIYPSSIDNKTMKSWVRSYYKSYLCGIICGEREACYCYHIRGIFNKVTKVKKSKVNISFCNNLFIAKW